VALKHIFYFLVVEFRTDLRYNNYLLRFSEVLSFEFELPHILYMNGQETEGVNIFGLDAEGNHNHHLPIFGMHAAVVAVAAGPIIAVEIPVVAEPIWVQPFLASFDGVGNIALCNTHVSK
jgi:hypothetical protein